MLDEQHPPSKIVGELMSGEEIAISALLLLKFQMLASHQLLFFLKFCVGRLGSKSELSKRRQFMISGRRPNA
ncbi:hypothetical protein [Paraburkholderia sp. 40]|uniref:hypothetical protein n=1 Tax=Paraburkholderia sp. 40 TaxID=2991059 RepID=UPI003D1DCBB7